MSHLVLALRIIRALLGPLKELIDVANRICKPGDAGDHALEDPSFHRGPRRSRATKQKGRRRRPTLNACERPET